MLDIHKNKWLTVEELQQLLDKLEANQRVAVNHVGNLAVLTPDGTHMVGYIDFAAHGTVEFAE